MCVHVSVCDVDCSCDGKINHYLVAMDFTNNKLTINGEQYFENLPELVKVSQLNHMTVTITGGAVLLQVYSEKPGPLGCVLSHPLVRKGVLEFYIDQESLKKSKWWCSTSLGSQHSLESCILKGCLKIN